MYRRSTVRELQRQHAVELAKRDEMIQALLDRIQMPERVPIWRIPPDLEPTEDSLTKNFWVADPEQLP